MSSPPSVMLLRPRSDPSPPGRVFSLGPQLNLTIWVLAALATVFLALRVYCKLWRGRRLWWDDHFLVASWVALVFATSVISAGVADGLGRHNADIDRAKFERVVLFSYASGFGACVATLWSKTSFALTLLRISGGWTRAVVVAILVATTVVVGGNGALQWLQCWPVAKLWKPAVEGRCLPSAVVRDYNTSVSGFSGAMDIVLALLPWSIIWGLTMNKKEKMGALFAMSMGVFAGITSLLKITSLDSIGNGDIATGVNLMIFGIAEAAITIVAASVPILRALLRDHPSPPPGAFVRIRERRWPAASRANAAKQEEHL
ncbi:hypothetical protein VTK73DRAFT_1353 [Phialemonium thermophilum]|uniref:Rhodopsin domain-containing protein n=1 Tax=Phialemonium thermophilum TaxID=223376 RepID=A0ABR3VTR2_9PEZI